MKIARLLTTAGLGVALACSAPSAAFAQEAAASAEASDAKVIGLRHIVVHVLDLEKTRHLYHEILGFKLVDSEVLGGNLAGMLLMRLEAGDLRMTLSVPPPDQMDGYGEIGNTNHNHFMLQVNDIKTIGDKLVAAGYELENYNYETDLWTFFTGPNGEIVGLAAYD